MEDEMPRDLFDQLDVEWRSFARSRGAGVALRRWQAHDVRFASFRDLADVLDSLRRSDEGERIPLMRAVVRLARSDSTAQRVALQAIVPGLARAARAYRDRWEADECTAMIVHFAIERLARWNDARPACPASAIVLEARRHLYVTHRREMERPGASGSCLSLDDLEEQPQPVDPSAGQLLGDLLTSAVQEKRLSSDDARLIYLTRVAGSTAIGIARDRGCAPSSIRRRRRRAERVLVNAAQEVA